MPHQTKWPRDAVYIDIEADFRYEVLKGLQSIDKNLDLIRKALEAKKKKNAKR